MGEGTGEKESEDEWSRRDIPSILSVLVSEKLGRVMEL
jgi:hypothetical protein